MSRLTPQQLEALGYCPETGRRVLQTRAAVVSTMPDDAAPKTRASSKTAAKPDGNPRPNKYRNTTAFGPDPCGGTRHYASKREARRAEALSAMKRDGLIADYFPQVSIPYGVDETGKSLRYVADFLVVQEYRADGSFVGWLEDPKGYATDTSKAKMAALRARGLSVRTI